MLLNLFLIFLILAGMSCILFYYLKKPWKRPGVKNDHKISRLIQTVDETFAEILGRDYYELNLNEEETKKRENIKRLIRRYLKESAIGDENAKEYIKDYIKEIVVSKGGINQNTIEEAIPFDNTESLKPQDKFEILLFLYKKSDGKEGLQRLMEKYPMDAGGNTITDEAVAGAYEREGARLSFEDKLEILAQRIFQEYKGFGVIDALREMKIDGVSAGISSAARESFLDIWIFYHGRTLLLDFLKFPSERELIRVCRNICRYNNPGILSETKGYLVNDMKDGSRVVVFRPPISYGWAFFVRKHDMITDMDIRKIITEEGREMLIRLLAWMVRGCLSIVITGEMGSGKTTLLKLLVQFIEEAYPIRVYEQVYELNLNKAYPRRNILSLRDSPSVAGQEILDIMKKTDGTVLILGEVASHEAANYLVEIAQISKMTLCSHHAAATEDFVAYLKIAQLRTGGFHNEALAEYQAANAVNIDIHMENRNGQRLISSITEIIPCYQKEMPAGLILATQEYYKRRTSPVTFETREIVSFQEGRYVFREEFSKRLHHRICRNLPDREREEYLQFLQGSREVHYG